MSSQSINTQEESIVVTQLNGDNGSDAVAAVDAQEQVASSEVKGLDSDVSTTQPESSLDESSNSMETSADTSSMLTNVTSASEMTENSTGSMEEEEGSVVVEKIPTPTGNCDSSLFEPIETQAESPNKRVREGQDETSELTQEVTEEEQAESSTQLEEPQAKKVKPNAIETSMISDTATDGSANNSSVTICCEEDEEIEVTLVYENKERALTFYKTVFEVEVIDQPEEDKQEVPTTETSQTEPDDVMIKGFKLNAKLSPKKKAKLPYPNTPRIFVPSQKLQSTLDRVKEFEGACVEECLDFTCVTCPEGNKLTLVKIDV